MDVKKDLKEFRKKIDPEIEKVLDEMIEASKKEGKIITDSLEQVKKITLSGGKRLRPALMYWGYKGVGGKREKEIIKTSVSIELIHIFLLIHDDIIDNDSKRHGVETIHKKYEKTGKFFPGIGNNAKHFGNSMGIIVGDIVGAIGNRVIYNSDFPPSLIVEALKKLQGIVATVAIGEAQDVITEYRRKALEKEVMDIYKNKTAKYTIEGPLHLGAILGGAGGKILEEITKFSVPIGVAFQIQDDILGIFGSEKKIGKPVGSDIREGKQTILVVKALENADENRRKRLEKLLGKENITGDEIREFRKIIIDTGALDYAKEKTQELVEEGKSHIEKIEFDKRAKNFLSAIADYMAKRDI
ncbi:MAG: polyprenyl synthetase family protein [Candidatus Moranbacteria bacterium]|jgi:geranylgeranyl diphosphate synthase type I|nr:polyprenyl synthetase family protein [Candidatus Moranbacteria bacterium]MDD5652367.1 polyprenyl synthetase family protein [Candidatus Moranbacteria bacterium]MDX9855285.1 polyprenyl synthetase family protein [Candidatus Moranbacteria bacterium]